MPQLRVLPTVVNYPPAAVIYAHRVVNYTPREHL